MAEYDNLLARAELVIRHAREDADGWEAASKGLTGRQYFSFAGVARMLRDVAQVAEDLRALQTENTELREKNGALQRKFDWFEGTPKSMIVAHNVTGGYWEDDQGNKWVPYEDKAREVPMGGVARPVADRPSAQPPRGKGAGTV